MNNKKVIKNSLIVSFEADFRARCINEKVAQKNIEHFIKVNQELFEQKAEIIIQEYESSLFQKVTDRIIIDFKDSIDQNKLSIKDYLNNLESAMNENHSSISNNISSISEQQRRTRIQILEDEIENIQLDLIMLKKHQSTLDKIAQKEASKVSWYFVIIAFLSLCLWCFLIYIFEWDKMEKWTYLSGGIVVVTNAIYFAIFERNFTSKDLRTVKFEEQKSHNYGLYKFDTAYISRIECVLENKKSELKELSLSCIKV